MTFEFIQRIRRRVSNEISDILNKRGVSLKGLHLKFLMACSNGIYIYDWGKIQLLIRGNFFGITETNIPGEYIVCQYIQNGLLDERSYVYICEIRENELKKISKINFRYNSLEQQPVRVHQIRFKSGYLWVTNTRQNVIWKTTKDGQILNEWTASEKFDYNPQNVFELTNRVKKLPNYHHYNSIAFKDNFTYILAHNSAGDDKSKESFLVKLDSTLSEVSRYEKIGFACHDIVFNNEDIFICNSGEGKLLKNFSPVLNLDAFLRGMTQLGSILIVGGSAFEENSLSRGKSDCKLFFIDTSTNSLIYDLTLGRTGDIHDLLAI